MTYTELLLEFCDNRNGNNAWMHHPHEREGYMYATDKYVFKRENDGSTPWKELQIS